MPSNDMKKRDRKALAKARREEELEDLREGRKRRSAVFYTPKHPKRKPKHPERYE